MPRDTGRYPWHRHNYCIVVPDPDVTYVLTHENKSHPTSPPRFVFIFPPKKPILLGLFLVAHLTGCQELVDAFEASERDCALGRSVRLGPRHFLSVYFFSPMVQ